MFLSSDECNVTKVRTRAQTKAFPLVKSFCRTFNMHTCFENLGHAFNSIDQDN